jgi:hypothetical protein
MVEHALCALLEGSGYTTRHLEAHPASLMDELLDGVDILLFAPGPIALPHPCGKVHPLGIMRKVGEVRKCPKAADLSQGY